jgi:S-adenosylmethionine:tRNA ribosyltransferase-isomerase
MSVTAGDFLYPLDERLIAQQPPARRDESRLMVLDRAGAALGHHVFGELPDLLRDGDLLVLNDTRVVPARFFCRRRTGGRIEGLFLRELARGQWEVLLKGANRCRIGEVLLLCPEGLPASAGQVPDLPSVQLELRESSGDGRWVLAVVPPLPAVEVLERFGLAPLPPYIARKQAAGAAADRERYQTVFARSPGAVAAPTAGLHFTPELLQRLARRGVRHTAVTLHVGLGTFAPVKTDDLSAHRMHREWYELPAPAAEAVNAARREGRRVVAVGTTAVRVLESAARSGGIRPTSGWTDLFLYPPAEFHAASAMITNFHLPRSTLLMLVAAFCGPGRTDGLAAILSAYAEAQRLGYRFYSYGDAMLIV